MNTDTTHECEFPCEQTAGVKNRSTLHSQLESLLLIQFSSIVYLYVNKKKRTTKLADRIYMNL